MANEERLNPFTDISLIDRIVKESNGAYTHDDVFQLELGFAYYLSFYYYEQSSYKARYQLYARELNKKQ